jgi:hypothetical protein
MNLPKTKEILRRLYVKYSENLKYAKRDIKPDYSGTGMGISSGMGYDYFGIDDNDRDFIYSAIGSLEACVNDAYGPIAFEIENHFITEKKALKELDILKDHILKDITRLKEIQNKYNGKKHSKYPIEVCLSNHEQVYEILEEIYNLDEFKEFKNPGEIDKLKNENSDLKFKYHWRKLQRKYLIHLSAFKTFLVLASWVIIHKDKQGLSAIYKTSVLVVAGLITIFFNILFNNHNTFKDSWKLLLKSSRENLKSKEKDNFLKSLK